MAIIKLLLVDDHGPLRKALREGLQATGAVQVLGEAATGREAVAKALELDVDVILMDVQLQDAHAGRKPMCARAITCSPTCSFPCCATPSTGAAWLILRSRTVCRRYAALTNSLLAH